VFGWTDIMLARNACWRAMALASDDEGPFPSGCWFGIISYREGLVVGN
jgi:hypothetical protein